MVKHCNWGISSYHINRKLMYSEYPNTNHNLVIVNIIVFLTFQYIRSITIFSSSCEIFFDGSLKKKTPIKSATSNIHSNFYFTCRLKSVYLLWHVQLSQLSCQWLMVLHTRPCYLCFRIIHFLVIWHFRKEKSNKHLGFVLANVQQWISAWYSFMGYWTYINNTLLYY